MVSIEKTSTRYRGQMAANYETKRKKQLRWKLENDLVAGMLQGLHGMVLDCPVGTGRYLPLYAQLGLTCIGLDSSKEMLALAKRNNKTNFLLLEGDARSTIFPPLHFDHAICVRFLDLIDEQAMRHVMQELMRVTKSTIICTIRFGTAYVPKVNTATHDHRKFGAMIKRKGWKITEQQPIFKQGWHVLKLEKDR